MRRSLALTAILWLAAAPARAQGEPAAEQPAPPARHFGGQRTVGFGPTLGLSNGSGGVVVVGGDPIGVVVSGGYMPVVVFGNYTLAGRDIRFNYYSSAQANADLLVAPWHIGPRVSLGPSAGYKFNTVLGHGVGAAFNVSFDLSRTLALIGSWGVAVFPGARDGLMQNEGYPADRSPEIPWLQSGVQVGLLVYP